MKLLSKNIKKKRKPIYEKRFWYMWNTLKQIVHKKISDETVAEMAFTCVFEEFQRNQFEILSRKWKELTPQHNKKKRLDIFIIVVAKNKLIDCIRKLFGRKQTPRWVKRMGPIYIETYNQLYCQNMSVTEILAKYQHDSKAYLYRKEIIDVILTNINKNTKVNVVQESEAKTSSVEQNYLEKEKEHIFLEISNIIFGVNPEKFYSKTANTFTQKCHQMMKTLDLSEKELNLIKQIYQNSMNIKTAGDYLSLSESQAQRLHKKAKDKILESIKNANLIDELSLLILEEQTI